MLPVVGILVELALTHKSKVETIKVKCDAVKSANDQDGHDQSEDETSRGRAACFVPLSLRKKRTTGHFVALNETTQRQDGDDNDDEDERRVASRQVRRVVQRRRRRRQI